MTSGPRIFCIPATRAPVLAVIRRGPSNWSHVGVWDIDRPAYEPGSWLRGHIYPQRCDLSPDGRWFSYFAIAGHADWALGTTYIAISRLPWLQALAAWGTAGTWTRGAQFENDRELWDVGDPMHGDVSALRRRYGLALSTPAAYAVERRRGWTETDDSPARGPNDMWDERRADSLYLRKPRPNDAATSLVVTGSYAAFRSGPANLDDALYSIEGKGGDVLESVQWADWSADGRLLIATADGRLQIRQYAATGTTVTWETDLAGLEPDPTPPPAEASQW
ncbi:MAG: hypothetical protein ABI912_09765 [Actinomycetota bacterium]